jgi:signal transduction histidine kinase
MNITSGAIMNTEKIVDFDKLLTEAHRLTANRLKEALPAVNEVVMLAEAEGTSNQKASAYLLQATYCALISSDYPKCLELLQKTEQFADDNHHAENKDEINTIYGHAYLGLGDTVKANQHFLTAIKTLERKPQKDFMSLKKLAHLNYNMFLLFNTNTKEITLEKYYNRAIELFEHLSDRHGIARCYNSMATVYYNQHDFQKALDYLLQALNISKDLDDLDGEGLYTNNAALVYSKLGDRENWEKFLAKALTLIADHASPQKLGMYHQIAAESSMEFGLYDRAVEEATKALELFNQIKASRYIASQYGLLSKAHSQLGQYQQAWEYQHKYIDYLENTADKETQYAVARARVIFELEQKEKETELLREKNTEIEDYARQLELSNEELRLFAHVASHDLREPVRMISSYVELLNRSFKNDVTDSQADYIKFIKDGAARMDELIADLLQFSKLNNQSNKEDVKLNNIINSIKANLSALIKEKNAVIESDELPVIHAGKTHMIQLFQNLVGNAVKYNLSGVPRVKITCTDEGTQYLFAIADNGIGIAAEFREKVFDIFQRLHSRHEFSGTGIGLTICRKIVDQMNGRIWVEDNNGAGTIFKFILPKVTA